MIDFNKIEATPEGLKAAIVTLREDFESHNHDGNNSKKFETITADSISAQLLSIRKPSYNDDKTGFWVGIVNNIMKLFLGNSTSYLRWDGQNLDFTGRSRQTFKISTIFENSTRFTQSYGLGSSISFDEYGVQLLAGTTANRESWIQVKGSPNDSISDIPVFNDSSFVAVCTLRFTGSGDGIFYIGTHGRFGDFYQTNGVDQYGFKAVKTSGVVALYATCGSGSGTETESLVVSDLATNTTILLSGVCHTNSSVDFRVKSVAGTSIDFSATHTTNIPRSSGRCNRVFTADVHNTSADDYKWYIASMTFEMFSGGLY